MDYKVLTLALILSLAPAFADVGIVVEFPDGCVMTDCVDADDGDSGYDILRDSRFNTLWSGDGPWGRGLCKINGIGTEVQGTNCEWTSFYWSFSLALDRDSSWTMHSPVGHNAGGCWDRQPDSFDGHYCAQDGDVLGYEFTDAFPSGYPKHFSFEEICESGSPPMYNCGDAATKKRRIQISDIEPDPLVLKAGESGGVSIFIENLGKMDETVTLDAELPEGWTMNGSTFNLTRRMGDITIDSVLSVPWDAKPKKYTIWLVADYIFGKDKNLMLVDVQPPEAELVRRMWAKAKLEEENLTSENSTNSTDSTPEVDTTPGLKRIRYEYSPRAMKQEKQDLTLSLYYLDGMERTPLADTEVTLAGKAVATDENGDLKLLLELGEDTLFVAEIEGFETRKVLFRPQLV